MQFELKLEQSASFLSLNLQSSIHETNVRTARRLSIPGLGTGVATTEPSAIDATSALLQPLRFRVVNLPPFI